MMLRAVGVRLCYQSQDRQAGAIHRRIYCAVINQLHDHVILRGERISIFVSCPGSEPPATLDDGNLLLDGAYEDCQDLVIFHLPPPVHEDHPVIAIWLSLQWPIRFGLSDLGQLQWSILGKYRLCRNLPFNS